MGPHQYVDKTPDSSRPVPQRAMLGPPVQFT